MWMLARTCALCLFTYIMRVYYGCPSRLYFCVCVFVRACLLETIYVIHNNSTTAWYRTYMHNTHMYIYIRARAFHVIYSIGVLLFTYCQCIGVLLAYCMPFNNISYIQKNESQPCT